MYSHILEEAIPTHAAKTVSRRTFAIISHPDAGKTTLTEKLLLFGGAIQMAGHIKARGERRRTRSDWLAIEQARGISVTSSVMTFEWGGCLFNLLDTPGHADFSEDTYRTLSAVDAAVMVIDAAKGIESQTRKLFEVCRLRDIPIVTFINKIDREGLEPLALLDEISGTLALDLTPMTWPIGMGSDFRGCLDVLGSRAMLPAAGRSSPFGRTVSLSAFGDISSLIEEHIANPALEGLALARAALPPFSIEAFHQGHLSPVFFGSALRDFSVPELLACLSEFAPGPLPRAAMARVVDPSDDAVTGFVFKVQANMDPHHRDRVAYLRIVSGRFRRGMKLFHCREKKFITVSSPTIFFAQQRETADDAYPGDIIGIPNHGTLRVGDTLSEGEVLQFQGIPNFAPEILRRVLIADPMRAKQLEKALHNLSEEGVVQVFKPLSGAWNIIGAVGALQLDVLVSRLNAEYSVPVRLEPAGYELARWVNGSSNDLRLFESAQPGNVARDHNDEIVFLARNAWTLRTAEEEWPALRFVSVQERGAMP